MSQKNVLVQRDKDFLIHTLSSPNAGERRLALGNLSTAVALKLFPREDFLNLSERLLFRASPDDAPFYLFEFGTELGVDVQPKGAMLNEYESLNIGKRKQSTLDQAERHFILKMLSSKDRTNAVLAARVMVQKRHLVQPDKSWVTDRKSVV